MDDQSAPGADVVADGPSGGLQLARRRSRGGLLHVRPRRREPDPVRPSGDRRLARRDDPPGLRAADGRAAHPAPARPPGASGRRSSSRATSPSAGPTPSARSATPATRSPITATSTRAPAAPIAETEERRLLRGLEALDAVAGVRPIGYRAPNWEMTYATPALLARHGFRYDSGLMDADHPYRLATGAETGRRHARSSCPPTGRSTTGSRYNYLPGLTGTGVIAQPGRGRRPLGARARCARRRGRSVHAHEPSVRERPRVARGGARGTDRAGPATSTASGWRRAPRSRPTSRRSTSCPWSSGLPTPARRLSAPERLRRPAGVRAPRSPRRPCRRPRGPAGGRRR